MIFLRFPDEATFLSVITKDEEGNISLPNIDVVGLIYEGGEYGEDGEVITEPVAIPGYHVNFIGELPPELDPYVIERPKKPYRIFAGQ